MRRRKTPDKESDRITNAPPADPYEISSGQVLDTHAAKIAEQFRLKKEATLEQTAVWLQAKDFEKHAEAIKAHFIYRLKFFLFNNKLLGEPLTNCIGKPNLTDETTWGEIIQIINKLLMGNFLQGSFEDIQEGITMIFGFPEGEYGEIIKCIEKGVQFEKDG